MRPNLIELVDEYRKLDRKRKAAGGKLSLEEEERLVYLKDYLTQAMNAKADGDERRTDLRVPVNLRVRYHTGETFANNYIHNLSSGGVFISTPRPLPLDTPVKLHIIFEDKNIEIEVEGKVVWENTQNGRLSDITKPGMGIKFLKKSPEAQEIIDELVHNTLKERIKLDEELKEEGKKRKDSEGRVKDIRKKPK